MSTKSTEELQLDIEELNTLLQHATRQKVKDLLTLEIRRLQTELAKVTREDKEAALKATSPPTDNTNRCYDVKLNSYGWDQTNSQVKLYVQLKDVHKLPDDAIVCKFTEKSVDLCVYGLENKNYHLPINNLCEEVDTEKSYLKVKTDMIVIFLVKKIPRTWSHITGVEKRIKESKTSLTPDVEEDGDLGTSLMNLMKKMYQEGDDEMKKTIAKAWTESQQKQAAGTMDF